MVDKGSLQGLYVLPVQVGGDPGGSQVLKP